LVALALIKLAWDAAILRHLFSRRMTPLRRSAMLMTRELSNATLARVALGLLGGGVMPMMLSDQLSSLASPSALPFAALAGLLFVACLAGELVERYLFFAACAAPRMPGGIR
jgi:hypothetical protein